MALLLTDSGTLVTEPVKTGTTWLRSALTALAVPWREGALVRRACPRHSPWWCYAPAPLVVATVRRPDAWVESVYRFHRDAHQDKPLPWQPATWYPHRALLGDAMPGAFADFLATLAPGMIGRYFGDFTVEPATGAELTVMRQESLADDLAGLLERLGYGGRRAELLALPRVHVTAGAPCWPAGARAKVLAGERAFLERWYPDG